VAQLNAPAAGAESAPVIRLERVSKSFGAIEALKDVSIELRRNECVGLVGDNGAGKSTLVKIVSGVHQPSAGRLFIDNQPVTLASPADARARDVETVYQNLALVDQLGVAGNLFLGREIMRRGWLGLGRVLGLLDLAEMDRRAAEAVRSLKVRIPDATMRVRDMSGGQRQGVAIARTVFWGRKALILDEPTAALGVQESEQVMRLIEGLQGSGLAMLVVSHNLQLILRLCRRVIVLRHGRVAAEVDTATATAGDLVHYIVGTKTAA